MGNDSSGRRPDHRRTDLAWPEMPTSTTGGFFQRPVLFYDTQTPYGLSLRLPQGGADADDEVSGGNAGTDIGTEASLVEVLGDSLAGAYGLLPVKMYSFELKK